MNDIESIVNSKSLDDIPDTFIELVKPNGTIFAGHIHQHKEFRTKGRNFIFVGCPYQQNLGDIGCDCGFYSIEESSSYEFHKISDVPVHVQFKCSEIMSCGLDSYDFSPAKGNIIQKIYDIDISLKDDLKIS